LGKYGPEFHKHRGKMLSLKGFELHLPNLPTEDEWLSAISGLEGLEKQASIVRARGYNLLTKFSEPKATFERIGWLNLWSKAIVALESAISAFAEGLDWVLQTTSRSTFEWNLHAAVLVEPIFDLVDLENSSNKVVVSNRSREYSRRITVERLRAYAAWCLWSDGVYYSDLLHHKTLTRVWDPNPAKKILANEKEREGYERYFGMLVTETDEELRKGRKEMEAIYREKKARIDRWLQVPQLKPWSDKITQLSRANKGNVSFLNLFDPDATVAKQLKKIDMRFGYVQYAKSSMALHGSSMDQFIIIGDSVITPRLNVAKHGDEILFETIIADCNRLFVLLGWIDFSAMTNEGVRS
jgi:hypothetical protein